MLVDPVSDQQQQEQARGTAMGRRRRRPSVVISPDSDEVRGRVLQSFKSALKYEPQWHKAWHWWAMVNFEAIVAYERRADLLTKHPSGVAVEHGNTTSSTSDREVSEAAPRQRQVRPAAATAAAKLERAERDRYTSDEDENADDDDDDDDDDDEEARRRLSRRPPPLLCLLPLTDLSRDL